MYCPFYPKKALGCCRELALTMSDIPTIGLMRKGFCFHPFLALGILCENERMHMCSEHPVMLLNHKLCYDHWVPFAFSMIPPTFLSQILTVWLWRCL